MPWSRCRWCGRLLVQTGDPQGRGHPPVWCGRGRDDGDPGCAAAYRAAFGTSEHDGRVRLVEGDEALDLGFALYPGAYLDAARLVADALEEAGVERAPLTVEPEPDVQPPPQRGRLTQIVRGPAADYG